jgi:hypothetical protein
MLCNWMTPFITGIKTNMLLISLEICDKILCSVGTVKIRDFDWVGIMMFQEFDLQLSANGTKFSLLGKPNVYEILVRDNESFTAEDLCRTIDPCAPNYETNECYYSQKYLQTLYLGFYQINCILKQTNAY